MNIHHLELFYFVAKHGGIDSAVRNMPYGIQQPAVSGQILQLEGSLGLRLFQRRPFQLTPAGRELYTFIEPFFAGLGQMRQHLRGETAQRLRLGGLSTVLRDHLPGLLLLHRRKFPQLTLRLHDANQAEAEALLQAQRIDLAITELEGKPAAGIRCDKLIQVPQVLMVSEKHRALRAADVLKATPQEPLIALPETETLTKLFRQALSSRNLSWPTSIEVSSMELFAPYVAAGFGVALTVLAPGAAPPAGTRTLPLAGFPPLVVAALWMGKLPPVAQTFLDAVRGEAEELRKQQRSATSRAV
jgi:DNA-binding transcriptional LysR family regulator